LEHTVEVGWHSFKVLARKPSSGWQKKERHAATRQWSRFWGFHHEWQWHGRYRPAFKMATFFAGLSQH
jgi:hypothetical protein